MVGYASKPPPGVQLNRNHVLAQGMISCFLFNEGSGLRANDLTQNAAIFGALTNFEPFSSTKGWNNGKNGTSLMFDGNTTYVDGGTGPVTFSNNSMTIHATINQLGNANNADAAGGIVSKGNNGFVGTTRTWDFYVTNAGVVTFLFSIDGVNNLSATGPSAISQNQWNSVDVTYNGTSVIVYVNSRPGTATVGPGGFFNFTRSIFVGKFRRTDVAKVFNGIIDNVYIWNRALSQREVQILNVQPFDMFKFRRL